MTAHAASAVPTASQVSRWMEGPTLWLIYLPLLAVGWLGKPPALGQAVGAGVALAIFMPAYLIGYRQTGLRLIASALVVLTLSFAFYYTGATWSVISVYAASMLGRLSRTRSAVIAVTAVAAAFAVFALITGQSWFYWAYGFSTALLVGYGNAVRGLINRQNQDLRLAHDEVRKISQVAERERIARDLHDLLGRTLTLIAVKADLAEKLLAADDIGAARTEARDIGAVAREGLAEVRAALAGTAGASLVHEIIRAGQALRAAGIEARISGAPERFDGQSSAVLAMVLREAVTNVLRHADARTCTIRLSAPGEEPGLEVRDDGRGGSIIEGGGLSGMRARMAAAGGRLDLVSSVEGVALTASLPEIHP